MKGPAKVMVAGGGIGGLTAAIALRRAGFEVVVFERTAELREIGAGLLLAANAQKAPQRAGPAPSAARIPRPGARGVGLSRAYRQPPERSSSGAFPASRRRADGLASPSDAQGDAGMEPRVAR